VVAKSEMVAANLVREMSALTVDSNAATTLGFPKDKEYRISVGEGLIVTAPTTESADAVKKAEAKAKLLLATAKSTARTAKTLKMGQAAAAEETATEAARESKEAAEVAVERVAEAVIAAEEEVQAADELGGQL